MPMEIATAITVITTVRPYVEPYVETLLWRGVSWVLGDVERPSDAIREVERWKAQQKENENSVMEGLGPYMYHERASRVLHTGGILYLLGRCKARDGQYDVWAPRSELSIACITEGSYFSPPDLAQIAHELDQSEKQAQDSQDKKANMDDTGHISVDVLRAALKDLFGLTLVEWRSNEMKPYQAVPGTQLAFVLNREQHWFTLRRFGHPQRKGHWFNLNSFLETPEWVGNSYLGTVFQQTEKEGYTVYVIRPLDPSNPEHMLPETEADLIAETLDVGKTEGQVQKISTTSA